MILRIDLYNLTFFLAQIFILILNPLWTILKLYFYLLMVFKSSYFLIKFLLDSKEKTL